VTSPGKAKNQQVVGKLPYIPLGTSNFVQTYGIAEKKYQRTMKNKFLYLEGLKRWRYSRRNIVSKNHLKIKVQK
jgi:hypothetical protein